jgi:pimeloyl-ACP methyl ester carboxylesterase
MRTGSTSPRWGSAPSTTCARSTCAATATAGGRKPPAYFYERYAADIAEVVDKLDLRDFVLIGHSMGGMVALVYAAPFPAA